MRHQGAKTAIRRSIQICIGLAFGLTLGSGSAAAAEPTVLHVNAFPNAKALPLHAGIAKGIFARHGFTIELQLTENSKNQREGLAAGKFDIVHSAVDNAVAMADVAKQDIVIVTGGDSGMNEFFVQGDLISFMDLRGRTIVVDAPDTAYALQVKKIMLKYGLQQGVDYIIKPVGAGVFRLKAMMESKDNAAGILNLPFTIQAQLAGMKSLGRTTDMLGPYQGAGAFTLRAWAQKNGETLERYIAAYVESLRWVRDRAHKAENIAILETKLKLPKEVAEMTYDQLLDPSFGFTPDAKFDMEGFRNMLALRVEVENGTPAAPERYVDLGYYQRAMKLFEK